MERMASIKAFPLTLVEAPSGFGKTTALRHFFDTRVSETARIIWHTFVSESMNSSWKSFCACIGTFDVTAAELLRASGVPSEDSLPEIRKIFRRIVCTEETYLVMDDFAAWELPNAGAFLLALSEHTGRRLHVVVASQVLSKETRSNLMPSIRFQLIQEAVLTFSEEDIDAYYRKAGIPLTAVQLEEAQKITGGWIMVLYLQLLSLIETGRFEKGGTRDLIYNALWNRLPAMERDFLMAISIFPHFSLSQATAFSGISAAETEALLREKRVFVHFDREARRFYLHSLFQDFLADQFALLPNEVQKAIYLAGGGLAEQAGDRVNTLRFYYLSGEWERLLALPLTSYEIADVTNDYTKPMILDIMEKTPFEIKRKYPTAMVPLAFTLFILHENQKLLDFREEIQQVIEQSDTSRTQKNALSGEMELLYSFLSYNRIDAMSAGHRKALELLGGPAKLINLQSTWTFGSPSVMYMYWREIGKLDDALGQMDACMPIYYALTKGHGSGSEIIMRAEVHLMRGELDLAEILCHKAMLTADSKTQNSIYQCGLFLLARIAILRGNETMLEDALHGLEERSRLHVDDLGRYTLDLVKGFLFMMMGRDSEIALWISAGEINDKRLVIMTQPFAYIIYCRLLLEHGEYQKLLGVSEYGLVLASIFPNLLPQLYIRLYQAQAFKALGNHPQAILALQTALDIALPDGIFLPIAENYDGINKLLTEVSCDSKGKERIAVMAAMLKDGLAAFGQKLLLSPREKEILELLKCNMKNKEIAERMHLSPNTVRNIISGMLEKCSFASREQLKTISPGK
ncbi:MAG: helix-turn-helix transcriptional regulator [Clostridiales bacterium]|nr:helix-turn-helix transcriptional regulator [Clostridiales bacterium]